MKISIRVPKPRNPFALAARHRRAGAHRHAREVSRREVKYAMRIELLSTRSSDKDGPI